MIAGPGYWLASITPCKNDHVGAGGLGHMTSLCIMQRWPALLRFSFLPLMALPWKLILASVALEGAGGGLAAGVGVDLGYRDTST